jgi:hypothetical protein
MSRPYLEITSTGSVMLAGFNRLLERLGAAPIKSAESAPLRAAS